MRIYTLHVVPERSEALQKSGAAMGMPQMLDDAHVQEIFYTHIGSIEDAGSGMIRVVRCIERHGMLIPVLSTVSPALSVLKLSKDSNEFARKLLREHAGMDH